jgi:hypothetical protein
MAHGSRYTGCSAAGVSGKAPGLVYPEGLVGRIYIERAADLKRHQLAFDSLRAQSLSEEESRGLIITTMKKLTAA